MIDLREPSFEALKVTHKRQFWLCRRASPAFTIHPGRAIHIQTCCFLTKMWKPLSSPAGWWPCRGLGGARASRMTYIFIPSSADRVMTRDASLSPDTVYSTTCIE